MDLRLKLYSPPIRAHLAHVPALLHADDAQVVLLAHPHQERLLRVVEDASPRGPVAAGVGGLQEPVPLLEQEVVADQLLLHLLRHPCHNTSEGLNECSR